MIKGEKYKLQWGRSSKTNNEEEEIGNKNNLKDINYKTECPTNDPILVNNVLTKAENANKAITVNNGSYNNISLNPTGNVGKSNVYNLNLNTFDGGKRPYYPSMDPNLMVNI